MTTGPLELAREAAAIRHRLLRHVRYGQARDQWQERLEAGRPYAIPKAWQALSAAQQAANLADAEADRIDAGPVYAVDGNAFDRLAPVISDPTWSGAPTGDILPSRSGMLWFPSPIWSHHDLHLTILTWGENTGGDNRQPITVAGWAQSRPRATGRSASATTGELVHVLDVPIAFSPHPNQVLDGALTLKDPIAIAARALVAYWSAFAANALTAAPVRVRKGPTPLVVSCKDDATEATAAAIRTAWTAHQQATGGTTPAALNRPPSRFAAELDIELPPTLRSIPALHRKISADLAVIEHHTEQRWPDIWSTMELGHMHGQDWAVQHGEQPWPNWCYVPVDQTIGVLDQMFGVNDDLAARYAPAVAGLAAWRATGRHALVIDLTTTGQITNNNWRDTAIPDDPSEFLPVPLFVVLNTGHGTIGTLAFTSWEGEGTARLWALNFASPFDSIDCFDAEYINLSHPTFGDAFEYFVRPASSPGKPVTIGPARLNWPEIVTKIALHVATDPASLIEAGHWIRRRETAPRWPNTPDPDMTTLWFVRRPARDR